MPIGIFDNRAVDAFLAQLFAAPGRTNDFRKLRNKLFLVATNLDSGASVTFGGPLVAAAGLRYGVARPFSGSVPTTETFAYGGDLDVRGIDERASIVAFLGANYLLTSTDIERGRNFLTGR